jgi:hypothetical protein
MPVSVNGNSRAGSRCTWSIASPLRWDSGSNTRLDLVVEQVDAQRRVVAHREQVEQRAAHRELAVFHDLGHVAVTGVDQPLAQRRDVEAHALVEHQHVATDVGDGRQPLHQRRHRQQQQAALEFRQPVERGQTRGDDVLVRGEEVVRQGLPVGETEHPWPVVAGEELQGAGQPVGRRRVGCDHDQRTGMATRGLDQCQRRGVRRQVAPGQLLPGPLRKRRVEG